MKKLVLGLVITCSALGLVGCSKHKDSSKKQKFSVVMVEKQASKKELPYSGTIKPLSTTVVTSPNDGLVQKMDFEYGQIVKKGQLLFVLNSDKFEQDFSSTLTKYITAKNTFTESKAKLSSQKDLYKDGLIARDAYQTAEDAYYNGYISLLQAKDALNTLLSKHKNIQINIDNLQLKDISQLDKLFGDNTKEQMIKVFSPGDGVALLPDQNTMGAGSSDSSAQSSGPISLGSSVKEGQDILSVGNLNGARINVNINEVNVNQVKPGLKAEVTSVAFPGIVLKGKVVSVGSQAKSQGAGIPTFPVSVVVPSLTKSQQAKIRVGMSAKVKIIINFPPQIKVPLEAVLQTPKGTFVKVQQADGSYKEEPVTTGQTGLDSVVILNGLKTGEKIAVPN